MSSRAKDTGFLRNLITYDGSGNITLPALLYILGNKEVATKEYVDTQNSGQVLESRTLTINGVTYNLSENRSWTIAPMVYPSAGIALSSGTGWGSSITNNSSNWNTAYGWGNHALAGYLTSFTETDPIWIADKPSYATKIYVDTSISNLVDSAPATLDTLNELAAALGDDPNFATSITTLIGTKEPAIAAGTTAQYWRGDKTWQTLPIYSLPIASATVLGGIKVGNNLSIDANGVLSAGNSYVLPTASATVLGGIKVGTNLSIDVNGVLSSTDTNTTYVNFTRTVSGLVPNPGGSTTNRYLREDGTWVIPPDTDTIVTSLPWTSITGRPTSLSQFTNDLGNYGNWLVRSGDSMSGRLTIDTTVNNNIPLLIYAVEPYVEIQAQGASNTAGIRLYPTSGYNALVGNFGAGELVLVAGNSEAVFVNSNSIRTNKYRFNGNGTLSGNGTPEIVDMASVGMAMQSLSYVWYNNSASTLLMSLNSLGNLTASGFFEWSDIRYKNVIDTNPDVSGLGIDVIKFTRHGDDIVRYGYSAQQVQSIIPEAVCVGEKLTVNYLDVHTLKIASLERRVKELEERLKSTL